MPRLHIPDLAIRRPLLKKRGHGAFLKAWVRSPLSMGAVIPSSRFLARKLASYIDIHRPGMVIELGAGTGVVTRALVDAGVKSDRLLIVERDRRLAHLLRRHFPDNKVVRGDAAELASLLEDNNVHKINAIVSSLPLLSLPKPLYDAIVEQMLTLLPPDGVLLQYTYGPKSPIDRRVLKHYQVTGSRVGKVWLNVPPAVVWLYKRESGRG